MMKLTWKPLSVHPFHLEGASKFIAKQWGLLDPGALGSDDAERMDAVRVAVESATRSTVLPRRDAKLALRMCVRDSEDTEWKKRAFSVVKPQLPGFGLRFLCHIYCHCYWDKRLRAHLAERFDARDDDRLPFPRQIADLLFSTNPPLAISRDAARKNLRLRQVQREYELPAGSDLLRDLQLQLLLGASKQWYEEMNAEEMTYAFESVLTTHEAMSGFVESFVQACQMSDWAPPDIDSSRHARLLMRRATKKDCLSTPRRHKARWSGASKATKRLVQWWVNAHEIAAFFDSVDAEPDRKRFWRRAARLMTDLHHSEFAGAFAMRIGDYYFVEFSVMGNACYVYSQESYERVKARYEKRRRRYGYSNRALAVDLWKDKKLLVKSPPIYDIYGRACFAKNSVRLIHYSGLQGWEAKFEAVIQRLTGKRLDSEVY